MMGKRSWVFIAVAALMVAICYANAIGPNSIDVDEKVIKKESKPIVTKEVPQTKETPTTTTTTTTTAEVKSTETPSTKKIDTTKLSKINVVQNELSGDDDDNYNEYSDYYEDDEELTKVSDKSTSIAPETKPADKDVKFRSIERTKVTPRPKATVPVKSQSKTEEVDSADDNDDEYENLDDVEALKCPQDCSCVRNMNNYLVATCTRLDPDLQKFSTYITDLEVIGISPKYPIVLGASIFKNIGLEHVSSIKIVNSTIENIHQSAFEGLDDLYAVNLTNTGLDMIHPDTFAHNKKLRILTLAGNDLHNMQRAVSPFTDYMLKAPSVEELDISNCGLKQLLPTAFNKLENIVFINLASNFLKSLPVGLFDKVDTIEELDLSHNSLTSLPENIFNRTALGILNLSYNKFKGKLDFGIPDLQALDLSNNKIDAIPNNMFKKFDGLTNLELRNNSIRKIHQAAFLPLKKLRNIDLSANALEQISSSIFLANRDLDVIRLNDNTNLKKLPMDGFESEAGTFDVKIFDASNCDLTDIAEKTFSTMPKLMKLSLAWNNIDAISKGVFAQLKRLADLDLNNNVIEEIDDLAFRNNRNLKKLNLAGNQLERISPRLFIELKDLVTLDISDCELVDIWAEPIPRTTFLRNLKMLNVSNNKISLIRSSDLAPLQSLTILDVTLNAFRCNNDFKTMLKWLRKKNIKYAGLGLNAELKSEFVETTKASSTWDELENVVCIENKLKTEVTSASSADSKDINESEIVDEISDEDEDDYDDEDEDDSDSEVITKDSLIAEELDVIKGLNERILDLEDDVLEGRHSFNFGSYHYLAPILITIFSVLVLLLLVAKLITLLMHRRYERYREALLASKNSIIYQKLSEDIVSPSTPKVHRYAPINQV